MTPRGGGIAAAAGQFSKRDLMMVESTIPPHLRKFVVRQDYAQYTEKDQAVWRFVLLCTHDRLLSTAHATYADGFRATGISTERIPEISQVSECLSRFGWTAAVVDGF